MSFKPGHPNHSCPHPTTILHKFAAIHPTTVLRSIHSEKSKTTNKIRNESKGRREQHHTHTHTETSRKELKAGKSKAAPPPLQRATVGTIKKKGKATGITQNKHRQSKNVPTERIHASLSQSKPLPSLWAPSLSPSPFSLPASLPALSAS